MKNMVFLLLAFLIKISSVNSQVFQVDTIQYKGDINKYINIVIMGDGYTSSQQDTFLSDATNLANYLSMQNPWWNYEIFSMFLPSGSFRLNLEQNIPIPLLTVAGQIHWFQLPIPIIILGALLITQIFTDWWSR